MIFPATSAWNMANTSESSWSSIVSAVPGAWRMPEGRWNPSPGTRSSADACFRIRSLFHSQGTIVRESESLLLMKTLRSRFDRLSEMVQELHSYEVPEIIAMPIMVGNPDYLAWIRESTEGPR